MTADAAGSPSTARDRAAKVVLGALMGSHDDEAIAVVDALCASPGVLRALAGEAEPTPAIAKPFRLACFGCSTWQEFPTNEARQEWVDEHEREVGCTEFQFRNEPAVVSAGGSAPADEVERLRWERDMALSRVVAAEVVQCRMGDSLPDSGPWESWSERDRAVRDYEGDLSAALAVEDDTVGERLREVERERDDALAEVEHARPVVEAAKMWHAWVSADLLAEPFIEGQARVLYGAVATYRAGGSAPHQGATTDETVPVTGD